MHAVGKMFFILEVESQIAYSITRPPLPLSRSARSQEVKAVGLTAQLASSWLAGWTGLSILALLTSAKLSDTGVIDEHIQGGIDSIFYRN